MILKQVWRREEEWKSKSTVLLYAMLLHLLLIFTYHFLLLLVVACRELPFFQKQCWPFVATCLSPWCDWPRCDFPNGCGSRLARLSTNSFRALRNGCRSLRLTTLWSLAIERFRPMKLCKNKWFRQWQLPEVVVEAGKIVVEKRISIYCFGLLVWKCCRM